MPVIAVVFHTEQPRIFHIGKDLLRFIKENKLGKVLPYQVQSGYGKYSDLCMAENLDLPLCLTVQSFFIAYL